MSGGITALEGFDYQVMVQLELILDHFQADLEGLRARPEGEDDLVLAHTRGGEVHRVHVQIKKPRQDASGLRAPRRWTLSELIDDLLAPRWLGLRDVRVDLRWILGDALGPDADALWSPTDAVARWAARRAAVEKVIRDRALAPVPDGAKAPGWLSPFRSGAWPTGTLADVGAHWLASFHRRAERAGFDAPSVDRWVAAIEAAHTTLDTAITRIDVSPR